MIHECKICNYATKYKSHLRTHLISVKHKKEEEKANTLIYPTTLINLPNTMLFLKTPCFTMLNKNNRASEVENKILIDDKNKALSSDNKTQKKEILSSEKKSLKKTEIKNCDKCNTYFTHRHHMLKHRKTCNFDKIKEMFKNTTNIDELLSNNICP